VSPRCGSSFPCSRVGTLFLHALRERIADRQHGELPACGGCSAPQTGIPTRSTGTRMAEAYCPAVLRVFATVARDGAPFLAIVFAHMTRGIGSESQNCPLERVLKSATSVGYCFGVDAHGAEIERASRVQTGLEQLKFLGDRPREGDRAFCRRTVPLRQARDPCFTNLTFPIPCPWWGMPASLGPRLKTGSRANRRIGEN
jgi:hypothetical protein